MAVLQTTVFRVLAGKTQDFVANVTTAKRLLERFGARVRVVNQIVGTNAPCTIIVTESADWNAYGALQTKMQTDSEWQAFFAKAILNNRDPAAELIGTGLSVEVPVG